MIKRLDNPIKVYCSCCNKLYDEYSDFIKLKCGDCSSLDFKKLFLDDERDPIDDSWLIFRNVKDLIEFCKKHVPLELSLDHDLGENCETGYDFIKQYVELCINDSKRGVRSIRTYVKIYVHSQNPVGKENIEKYWKSYLQSL